MKATVHISCLISLLTLCCLSCTFYSAEVRETKTQRAQEVFKTTICQVVSNPSAFDGKLIELRGSVLAGLETNVIYDKSCETKRPLVSIIFVEAPDAPKTEEQRKFWSLVQTYKEPAGKRHSIVPDKYTVAATVVGRFEAASPSRPEIAPGGRLTLQSVRDVVANPFDGSFFPTSLRRNH